MFLPSYSVSWVFHQPSPSILPGIEEHNQPFSPSAVPLPDQMPSVSLPMCNATPAEGALARVLTVTTPSATSVITSCLAAI